MAYNDSERDKSTIYTLLCEWEEDFNRVRPQFDLMKRDYLAYMRFRDPNSHPYKYNPAIPLVFTISENIVSTVVNSFFMKDNPLTIEPVEDTHGPNPDIRDADIARQLSKVANVVSMHPDREFLLDFHDFIQETTVFGTGFSMNIPEFDHSAESDIGGPLYLGPKIVHIPNWDLIPDKECYRLSQSAGCRRVWLKEWVSVNEYKRRVKTGGYRNLSDEELEKLAKDKNWMPEDTDVHEDLLSRLGRGARPRDGWDSKNGNMLLLHYYDMDTMHITTLAANRMIVRQTDKPTKLETSVGPIKTTIQPYPYMPFDDLRLWSFAREFYAQGVGRIAAGFQDEINLLKSMRLENIELGIFKTFLVNDMFVEDEDDIVMMPGGLIRTKDVNSSIKPIEVGDITQNAYTEQAMWEKEAQDATSSQETTRGNAPARRETATTVVQLQRNAMKRTETFLKKVGHWYKSNSLKTIVQIRTYMSQREYERISGEADAGFYRLSVPEIRRMFDLKPSSASIEQITDMAQQNFINALQMVQGSEDLINRAEWIRLGMELFFPHKNPDKYIISQEQAAQMQAMGMTGGTEMPPGSGMNGSAPTAGNPALNESQLVELSAQGMNGGS
jgi:hypothetical protein